MLSVFFTGDKNVQSVAVSVSEAQHVDDVKLIVFCSNVGKVAYFSVQEAAW